MEKDSMEETKKRYDEMKKKLGLPDFDALKREFSIGKIEEESNMLSEIIKRIDDRIELFEKIINRMLQPDTTISDLYECKIFTDNDKKGMFETYKKLMIMHDSALIAEIESDDRKTAAFISDSFRKWPSLKKDVLAVVGKMKDSWIKDIDISEDIGYLG